MSIEFKLLDISSLAEQLKVHSCVFGSVTESYWKIKHYLNPVGNSLIFGAFIDSKLVGINCFQPYIYKYCGIDIKVLQSCESGVLKEYQGKGIWSKLMSYAYEYILKDGKYDILIGFPNYRTSYSGFLKMGWTEQFTMVNYVMVNNLKLFINTFVCHNLFVSILFNILRIQRTIIDVRFFLNKNKISIEKCNSDELLWRTNDSVLQVTKDSKFLDWKLLYKNCRCINIRCDKRIIGSCVYGVTQHNKVTVITINKISQISDSPISIDNIIAVISKYISKEYPNAAYIRTWCMPEEPLNKVFRSLLFKKMKHPNPFITKYINNDYLSLKWDVSFLDLD